MPRPAADGTSMWRCRFLLVALAVLLVATPLCAGGSKENDQKGDTSITVATVVTNPDGSKSEQHVATGMASSMGLRGRLILSFAGIFDNMTNIFCEAMSPFPSVYRSFRDAMLSGTGNDISTSTLETVLDVSPAVGYKAQFQEGKEKDTWSMVMSLFLAFLALEVVFTTVKMFATQEDGIVKAVLARVLTCMLLIGICSLLPFLVEATRFGFQQMALTMFPTNLDVSGKTVASLPGNVLRSMAVTLDSMDPERIGVITPDESLLYVSVSTVIDSGNAFNLDALLRGLATLAYLAVYLLAASTAAVVALHVMVNVLEVYLLLGIVICLVPFQVFGMTKFMGEKAIPSLFANIMELFVIMCIFYSTSAMMQNVSQTSARTVAVAASDISLTIKELSPEESNYLQGKMSADEKKVFEASLVNKKEFMDYCSLAKAATGGYKRVVIKDQERWIEQQMDKVLAQAQKGSSPYLKATASDSSDIATSYADLGAKERYDLFKKHYFTTNGSDSMIVCTGYGGWDSDIVAIHLMSCLLGIVIQAYFLAQSSQIANGLLAGNASTDGFGGAAVKGMYRASTGAILTTVVKAPGGIVKGGLNVYGTHLANKANKVRIGSSKAGAKADAPDAGASSTQAGGPAPTVQTPANPNPMPSPGGDAR